MELEQLLSRISGLILARMFVTYVPKQLEVSYAVVALFVGLFAAFYRFYEVVKQIGINKPLILRFLRSYVIILIAAALIATLTDGTIILSKGSLKLGLALLLSIELSLLPGERRPYTFVLAIPLTLRDPIRGYLVATGVMILEERLRK